MAKRKTDRIEFKAIAVDQPIRIEAADGDGDSLPKLILVAYSGGIAYPAYGPSPLVIDVRGVKVARKKLPVRFMHSPFAGIGHTLSVSLDDNRITAEGVVSRTTSEAEDFVASARQGFPWQCSFGGYSTQLLRVDDGESVNVNGQVFKGPLYVAEKSVLEEISIVDIGGDEKASAAVAAARGGSDMAKSKSDKPSNGATPAPPPDDLDATNPIAADGGEGDTPIRASGSEPTATPEYRPEPQPAGDEPSDAIAAQRRQQAEEIRRVEAIHRICGTRHLAIEARAVEEGWTPEKTELEMLKASRQRGHAPDIIGQAGGGPPSERVLECALRLNSSEPTETVEADYDERTLEMASRHRRLTLKGLFERAILLDGGTPPLIAASDNEWIQAAFSTAALPGILGNTMNKTLLSSFRSVPSAARKIARKLTANDFKTHTGYRMDGDAVLKKVGSGGELKKGTLGESSFTYNVDTFGRLIGITRQQQKNDDLGAFTDIPRFIGRGAALAIEKSFFDLLKANTGNFFHADNSNYVADAAAYLGISGLDLAVAAMRGLTDTNGDPILIDPKYLLVPPALEGEANRLYMSDGLVADAYTAGSKSRSPATNTYKGRYEPVVSPHLTATKVWYLFGDPADVAAFGIAYLNGFETPVVEEVPLSGEYLGRLWRGYIDFGVCQIETQGAVMSKGEA